MEPGDQFDADDAPLFRSPPPPDDRLWRHPSELARRAPAPPGRRPTWPLALVSGVSGAVLTVGLLAVTGAFDDRATGQVVVREVVRPAVATVNNAGDDVGRIAEAVSPSIVRLHVSGTVERVGSGVLFRDDGHVLTNAHIVHDGGKISAVLSTGQTVSAHVVGDDLDTDIAVLKLDSGGPFQTAVLGTTDGMAVGAPAIAIGASVSSGVVSAMGREISPDGERVLVDMIQTDAAVDAHSSGGALLDGDGTVIGITTAYAGAARLGFATPVDVARAVADDLLGVGRVRVVWLGVKGSDAPDGGGVAVAEVVKSGPAARFGIEAGDVIRRVDGRPVATMSAIRIVLRRRHPGDPVNVVFDREGARRNAVVVLAEHDGGS